MYKLCLSLVLAVAFLTNAIKSFLISAKEFVNRRSGVRIPVPAVKIPQISPISPVRSCRESVKHAFYQPKRSRYVAVFTTCSNICSSFFNTVRGSANQKFLAGDGWQALNAGGHGHTRHYIAMSRSAEMPGGFFYGQNQPGGNDGR